MGNLVHILLSKAASLSQAERLKNCSLICVKSGVSPKPPLREEILGKGKIGVCMVGGIVMRRDNGLRKRNVSYAKW